MAARKTTLNRSAIRTQLNTIASKAQEDLLYEADKVNTDMQEYIQNTSKESITLSIDVLDEAPRDWNFFPKLDQTKFQQLKMSIMNNGILTPVIVWEKNNGRYMILSGHNRVRANREIMEEYADCDLHRDYKNVPVIIYGKDEIDESKAKEIIIDTNYIQRGQFDPELRVLIVKNRMDIMKKQTDEKGRRIDKIIDELGIKKSAIYEDLQIGEKLIPEFQQMYYDRIINRKAVLKLASFMEPVQRNLYEKYHNKMNNENIMKLKKNMRRDDEFDAIFNIGGDVALKSVKLDIPEKYYESFMEMYKSFAKGKWEV